MGGEDNFGDSAGAGSGFFFTTGSTAANASNPLMTSGGRVMSLIFGDVELDLEPGSADDTWNWKGWKTSYLVDHFNVFSYPEHFNPLLVH